MMSDELKIGFISIVVYAFRDVDGVAKVATSQGLVSLAKMLGEVIACKGRYDSLGSTFDDSAGVCTLVTVIFITVPYESEAANYFKNHKKE